MKNIKIKMKFPKNNILEEWLGANKNSEIDKIVEEKLEKIINTTTKEELEEKLVVGAKVKVGKIYAKEHCFSEGEILSIVEGYFEYTNGLYTNYETAPAVWDEEKNDFYSIYHLFGNDLEDFADCEVL